jgi:hypothetical protein
VGYDTVGAFESSHLKDPPLANGSGSVLSSLNDIIQLNDRCCDDRVRAMIDDSVVRGLPPTGNPECKPRLRFQSPRVIPSRLILFLFFLNAESRADVASQPGQGADGGSALYRG